MTQQAPMFQMLDAMMASKGISMLDITRKQVAETLHLPLEDSREARYMCSGCGKTEECHGPPSFLKCTKCKAVHYCNRKCQKQDWLTGGIGTKPITHKQCCPDLAKDRSEFQESPNGMVVRTQVFPWANCHHESGAFFINEFLERRGLFGQEGFWARTTSLGSPYMSGDDPSGWCHGQMLLGESLPSIKEGWVSLKDDEIPSGDPVSAPESLYSWAEFCRLRNVSSSSIAPILLTNVLTIFQILTHELKLYQRQPRNGRHYVVYVLGAESELNSLPLLEELAFLLPEQTGLELRIISPAVKHLLSKAASDFPNSHVMTCGDFVIDKTAPGGRRVFVSLEREEAFFHDIKMTPQQAPDAAIGLNAGIASYADWPPTILKLQACEIPFSFSDYMAQTMRFARDISFPSWNQHGNVMLLKQGLPMLPIPILDIRLNPFHGVVGRDIAVIMTPNIPNGYLLTWKGKDAS